jgi:hypothetical protein
MDIFRLGTVIFGRAHRGLLFLGLISLDSVHQGRTRAGLSYGPLPPEACFPAWGKFKPGKSFGDRQEREARNQGSGGSVAARDSTVPEGLPAGGKPFTGKKGLP